MRIHDLLLPKVDEADEDCEDRLAFVSVDTNTVRAAVADGATATAFSGQWAELLVKAYCDRPFSDWSDLATRCEAAAKQWALEVYSEDLPWHSLIRAQGGGAAAIAGIEIFINERKWSAVALGDSYIFQIRGERIYFALPPLEHAQFGNHPRLIFTDPAKNIGLASAYEHASRNYELGDRFVLATDAASEAFLQANLHNNKLRDWLRALSEGNEAGREFIDSLRNSHDIRDDDVAMVMIET